MLPNRCLPIGQKSSLSVLSVSAVNRRSCLVCSLPTVSCSLFPHSVLSTFYSALSSALPPLVCVNLRLKALNNFPDTQSSALVTQHWAHPCGLCVLARLQQLSCLGTNGYWQGRIGTDCVKIKIFFTTSKFTSSQDCRTTGTLIRFNAGIMEQP